MFTSSAVCCCLVWTSLRENSEYKGAKDARGNCIPVQIATFPF